MGDQGWDGGGGHGGWDHLWRGQLGAFCAGRLCCREAGRSPAPPGALQHRSRGWQRVAREARVGQGWLGTHGLAFSLAALRHRTDAVPRHGGRGLGGLHGLLGRSRHLPSFGFRQVGEEAHAAGGAGASGRAVSLPGSQARGAAGPLASHPPFLPGRKKVLDFYQRACLSGYCSAFAYKPMSCTLSSQLNGKCIELVQAPGQSSIFTVCELPSTVPIKLSTRRNSWSSDGTVRSRPGAGRSGRAPRGPWGHPSGGHSGRSPGPGMPWRRSLSGDTGRPLLFSCVSQCCLCPSSRVSCDPVMLLQGVTHGKSLSLKSHSSSSCRALAHRSRTGGRVTDPAGTEGLSALLTPDPRPPTLPNTGSCVRPKRPGTEAVARGGAVATP